MPRIIEVWRKSTTGIPCRFVVGQRPMMRPTDSGADALLVEVEDSPVVKAIKSYATGAFKGDAFVGPCLVVHFVDSDIRRIIPAHTVIDVAFDSETSKIKAIKSKLEDSEDDVKTPELPEE